MKRLPDRHARAWLRYLLPLVLAAPLASCEVGSSLMTLRGPSVMAPLDYVDWLQSADAPALENERRRLETLPADSGDAIAPIQLGLLLSMPDTAAARDRDRAATLLAEAATPPTADGENAKTRQYRTLGRLWLGVLRDGREAQDERLEIEALRDQVRELKEQIEALTTIEQQLIEREQRQIQATPP